MTQPLLFSRHSSMLHLLLTGPGSKSLRSEGIWCLKTLHRHFRPHFDIYSQEGFHVSHRIVARKFFSFFGQHHFKKSRRLRGNLSSMNGESFEQRMMLSATVFISEVHPTGSSSGYAADWFEVTNTGPTALDITGWQMDDNSNGTAEGRAPRFDQHSSREIGCLFRGPADGTTDATNIANFSTAWFGSATPPAGVLIGAYGGSAWA